MRIKMREVYIAIVGAAFLFPSANYLVFSGLPLDTVAEFTALCLLVPLVLSRDLRERLGDAVEILPDPVRKIVLLVPVAVLLVKVLLLTSGTYAGYRACYRMLEAPTSDPCEKTFDDLFTSTPWTRFDRTIDFGRSDGFSSQGEGLRYGDERAFGVRSSDWNLAFRNGKQLGVEGLSENLRPSFQASWTGVVAEEPDRPILIRYVGEGSIRVGDESVVLPDSYDQRGAASVAIAPGRHRLSLDYRFDASNAGVPYAELRLLADDGPLEGTRPSGGTRLLGMGSDLGLLLLLGAVAFHYGQILRPMSSPVLGTAVAGAASLVLFPRAAAVVAVTIGVALAILVWNGSIRDGTSSRLFLFFLGVFLWLVWSVSAFPDLAYTIYRYAGNDPLTYESQARSILTIGSLRGGEDVFVYSPAFRYLLFVAHVIFGESDPLLGAFFLAVLSLGIVSTLLFILETPTRRGSPGAMSKGRKRSREAPAVTSGQVVVITLGLLLLLLQSSSVVREYLLFPLSEGFTWIAWAFVIPVLFRPGRLPAVGAVLIGLIVATRFEQVLGVLVLMAAAGFYHYRLRDVTLLRAGSFVSIVAVIVLLPAVHNFYYGGSARILPSTPDVPVNFPLSPSDLLDVPDDSSKREILASQLRGVTAIGPTEDVYASSDAGLWVLHALQLVWIFSLVRLFLRTRETTLPGLRFLVAGLPAALLLPHVFVQVYNYYPRHVIVGHLAMGLMAGWAHRDA